MASLLRMIRYAKDSDNGKPTLIVCKTIIGKGIDEIAGTCAAHGEAGVKYQDSAREALGRAVDTTLVLEAIDARLLFAEGGGLEPLKMVLERMRTVLGTEHPETRRCASALALEVASGE